MKKMQIDTTRWYRCGQLVIDVAVTPSSSPDLVQTTYQIPTCARPSGIPYDEESYDPCEALDPSHHALPPHVDPGVHVAVLLRIPKEESHRGQWKSCLRARMQACSDPPGLVAEPDPS
ncbi:hypothetical protein PIB30_036502 [Stylosanthes scabra]|uniref:Uncharacterized protein n=1 Tax=Stylosanthes scabra TaxID=79078 RepID=A0ABU6ZC02_9FABA|nr:hypothetical protein [Stylosanthes scabra]